MFWVSCFKWQPEKAKLHSITFIKYCLQWPNSVSLLPAVVNLITCSTSHKTSLPAGVNTATFHPLKNDWQPVLLSVRRQSDMLLARLFQIITSNHMSWRRWVVGDWGGGVGRKRWLRGRRNWAGRGGQVAWGEQALGSYQAGDRRCPGGDPWCCAAVFSFSSSGRGMCTSARLKPL